MLFKRIDLGKGVLTFGLQVMILVRAFSLVVRKAAPHPLPRPSLKAFANPFEMRLEAHPLGFDV